MEKALTRVWSSGLPLRDHIDLRRRDFDNIAIAIIRALSAGSTDEVAARQLSVSPRTYRRHLASIMERLGITTRFQLGARAAELGLPG
nr:LuxR C-terminal-related transcriptional regulator [Rhodococcus erythropolis]